jgi:YegS/Rv2252/BmrU family lipid kinase
LTNIHFIVNPIAGKGKTEITHSFLSEYFEDCYYSISVKETAHKTHAIQLTRESITEGAHIIVACGGDGTINEVASELVNSSVVLGIIPIGSGNGLASNLKISKNIKEAILTIRRQNSFKIDVGKVNDTYFFSNTGFGFDATVIKNYEASKRRMFSRYAIAALKSFREIHKQNYIEFTIDDKIIVPNPFLIFISNSNVMGYNLSLTPNASLQDGLLDVIIVPRLSKWKMLVFGILMLVKKVQRLKEVNSFQVKEIKLSRTSGDNFQSQVDGEFLKITDHSVTVKIDKAALLVLA